MPVMPLQASLAIKPTAKYSASLPDCNLRHYILTHSIRDVDDDELFTEDEWWYGYDYEYEQTRMVFNKWDYDNSNFIEIDEYTDFDAYYLDI
ncbi:MAG: hypothetical protein K9J24_15980 [Bacteroidales bacterium]|nr:hypothetical protein [Bacteroidales bacterium]